MSQVVECANCEKYILDAEAPEYYIVESVVNYFCCQGCREKWFADTFHKNVNGCHKEQVNV